MQKWMQIAISFALIAWLGCDKKATDPKSDKGTLRVFLTDAVAQYDAVNITFSEVSAHIDGKWVTISDDPQTVNLLDLSGGKIFELGSAEVEAGKYTQIRLKITDAEVVLNEELSYPLEVPSGAQSGLKLLANFEIVAGTTFDVVIDFDAERSVVATGSPNDPKFILKPTIRVTAMAITGSISGTVTNPADLPVAYAIAGDDTVTSSPVDGTAGSFKLAFLPPGGYTVSVADTTDKAFTQANVPVTANQDNSLGQVTLQ